MAKYDDAYFENLTKKANVIYRCLYLNEINDNLKNAIISYLDVYFDAYKKYSNLEQKDDDLVIDEYGKVSFIMVIGALLITLGVIITIIMIVG